MISPTSFIESSMSTFRVDQNEQSTMNKTATSTSAWNRKSSSKKKYYLTVVSRLPNMKGCNLNTQFSTIPKKRIKWLLYFKIYWAIIILVLEICLLFCLFLFLCLFSSLVFFSSLSTHEALSRDEKWYREVQKEKLLCFL